MQILRDVLRDFSIYFKPNTRAGKFRLGGLVLAVLLIGGGFMLLRGEAPSETPANDTQAVTVRSAGALSAGERTFRTVGTVRAVSEARLQTEASGRVTSVNATIGDRVQAGAVLATLENARERASLIQAEGAYDAAVAAGATSASTEESAETGLDAAQASGMTAYTNAFITADSIIRNTADDLFSNPTGPQPGFRLNGFGQAPALNVERGALESILDTWRAERETVTEANVDARLESAERDLVRIAEFVETLALLVARNEASATFFEAEKDALEVEFASARSSLSASLQSVRSAETTIRTAREALARAEIGASNGEVSLSDAQIKQALGGLRAAQAAYENTIVRSPISGVVNAMYLRENEYVGMSAPAAVVANNNALEIATTVNERDREALRIGDRVTIEGSYAGTITAIAPAIDPITRKIEVLIGVSDDAEIENGDTVSVEFTESQGVSDSELEAELRLPIEAIKMAPEGPVVFMVENGTLVARDITLGGIEGGMAEVTGGIDAGTQVVADVRGLTEGTAVTVTAE